MAEESTESPEVREIRQLVRLMQRYDLTAIDIDEGSRKIRLRRRGAEVAAAPPPPVLYSPPPASTHAAAPVAAPSPTASTPIGVFIESPMVGTFYASASPDAPAFVSVGSMVRDDTTIGIIEAMKVFTDIPARAAGKVVECLVKSGQAVEYGQPLFRVEPA